MESNPIRLTGIGESSTKVFYEILTRDYHKHRIRKYVGDVRNRYGPQNF